MITLKRSFFCLLLTGFLMPSMLWFAFHFICQLSDEFAFPLFCSCNAYFVCYRNFISLSHLSIDFMKIYLQGILSHNYFYNIPNQKRSQTYTTLNASNGREKTFIVSMMLLNFFRSMHLENSNVYQQKPRVHAPYSSEECTVKLTAD